MFPWAFLFFSGILGLILRVAFRHFLYATLIVCFTHLFTNGITVKCFCTVHEGLMFTAQEGQVA